jgi:anti-sigma regulatory factor (Ser/Thr protein kinase)
VLGTFRLVLERADVVSLPLRGDHAAAREARRFVLAHLPDRPAEDDTDRVLLCVSELVSNAIEHGRDPRRLDLLVTDRDVRVEVHDGDPRQPEPQVVSPMSLRGRGLQIVETAADRWGVTADGPGKLVWFEIAVSPSEPEVPRRAW